MPLFSSYAAVIAIMLVATVYLFLRLRLFVTTSTMLLGSLLLVYGPALLSFTLSSGRAAFLFRALTASTAPPFSTFPMLEAKVGDLTPVIMSINFSIALMYVGIIFGFEAIGKLFPTRIALAETALREWKKQPILDDINAHRCLLIVITTLFAAMFFVSIREGHLHIINHFFSIEDNNDIRNAYRAHFGGSPNYAYRVVLSAVAPMFVIWGFLASVKSRSYPLLFATCALLILTMLGKIETLSKAPPAFLVLQFALAMLLVLSNRISWRVAIAGTAIFFLVVYVTTRLVVIFPAGYSTIESIYVRIFEAENETLVENFAVFPHLHPFMWGANLRPVAALLAIPYTPSFNIVGFTWYHTYDITSPTLFIADAWADFSYAGVFAYSVAAGAICRAIDIAILPQGKSTMTIAVFCATFWGVLTLITTALSTALVTGGLLLGPILAGMVVVVARRTENPA